MGGWPVGYLHNAVEELNSGLPRTNPDSGRVEDLNQGPPDFKSSALNHSTTPQLPTYNLGQYKMEQLSPIPPQSNDEGAKEQETPHFGIIEMGEGVDQMFHLFCPRL